MKYKWVYLTDEMLDLLHQKGVSNEDLAKWTKKQLKNAISINGSNRLSDGYKQLTGKRTARLRYIMNCIIEKPITMLASMGGVAYGYRLWPRIAVTKELFSDKEICGLNDELIKRACENIGSGNDNADEKLFNVAGKVEFHSGVAGPDAYYWVENGYSYTDREPHAYRLRKYNSDSKIGYTEHGNYKVKG